MLHDTAKPSRLAGTARKDFHHPFEPYDIQQEFMEALYECIEQGRVGIFESPTGTGKSLSLICGALTWLRENKRRTFDESIARVAVDDDEPQWMIEHAKLTRSREIRHMRADLDLRLSAIREREKKIKERHAGGEPAFKKRKQLHETEGNTEDEDQFLLDDYESDKENTTAKRLGFSIETTKLMEQLGLLPPSKDEQTAESVEELKVYFCSRTHSQLSQFIGELKRVKLPPGFPPEEADCQGIDHEYTEDLKHLTLGSRKNLCINPKVSRLPNQTAVNERCTELQQSSTPSDAKCRYLPNKETEDMVLNFRDHALATIRDIEDLSKLGSKLQICPYYASRPAIDPAEIVTLPYPLLLQKAAREALGISLKGHIVVIDEAHNLMNAVEGIHSAQISDSQLKRAKDGLLIYLQKFRNRLKGSNRSYVTQVVRVIDSLLRFTDSVRSELSHGSTTTPSALLAGKAVDQINLTKLVTYINGSKLARKVEGYVAHVTKVDQVKKKSPTNEAETPTLTLVQNFLMTLMNPSREGRFMWSRSDDAVSIRYLLLDPSEHFREIVEESRAVVLAGGTMSPMEDYRQQLFPYLSDITTFSCGHLIPASSLFVRAITSDNHGRIDFSFKSRNESSAKRLGLALISVAAEAEGGLVVFFPSYAYLESVVQIWNDTYMLKNMQNTKAMFFDSRDVSAEDTFRAYSEAVRTDKRGALLLSVIGGKLSEGINFSDDLGRCVVVVGLPYPNLETPEWKAKLQYLDETAAERGEPRGKASKEHAENVCMRSVNQAIGRAIRHKNDWASILLFDARYIEARIWAKLPQWIMASFDAGASGAVGDVVRDLEGFFDSRRASTRCVGKAK